MLLDIVVDQIVGFAMSHANLPSFDENGINVNVTTDSRKFSYEFDYLYVAVLSISEEKQEYVYFITQNIIIILSF